MEVYSTKAEPCVSDQMDNQSDFSEIRILTAKIFILQSMIKYNMEMISRIDPLSISRSYMIQIILHRHKIMRHLTLPISSYSRWLIFKKRTHWSPEHQLLCVPTLYHSYHDVVGLPMPISFREPSARDDNTCTRARPAQRSNSPRVLGQSATWSSTSTD